MATLKSIWQWLQLQADLSETLCRNDVLRVLSRRGAPYAEPTLLDCGCGDGEFTIKVAKILGATRTLGVDVLPENVALLRLRGIEGVVANLDRGLPIGGESVDVIVASHVIEHVADTDTLVREAYRVLKPRGDFVVATPNLGALLNIIFLLLGKQPTIVEVSDVSLVGTWSPRGTLIARHGPAHRRVFTSGALTGLLEYYGFKCVEVVASGFLPLPVGAARLAARVLPLYASNIIVVAAKH